MPSSKPVRLSDEQVRALAGGKAPTIGDGSRPRALSPKQVDALRNGDALKLEDIPVLQRIERHEEADVQYGEASRPRALTNEDVVGLREGKQIDLDRREPLKPLGSDKKTQ